MCCPIKSFPAYHNKVWVDSHVSLEITLKAKSCPTIITIKWFLSCVMIWIEVPCRFRSSTVVSSSFWIVCIVELLPEGSASLLSSVWHPWSCEDWGFCSSKLFVVTAVNGDLMKMLSILTGPEFLLFLSCVVADGLRHFWLASRYRWLENSLTQQKTRPLNLFRIPHYKVHSGVQLHVVRNQPCRLENCNSRTAISDLRTHPCFC